MSLRTAIGCHCQNVKWENVKMANVKDRMSLSKCQMAKCDDAKCQMSNVKISNVKCQMSNVTYFSSNVKIWKCHYVVRSHVVVKMSNVKM